LADRIQERAVRRCEDLLKAFNTVPNRGWPKENGEGTLTVSRREAAEQPGLSRHQQVTAFGMAKRPRPSNDNERKAKPLQRIVFDIYRAAARAPE
jgi:hypothetical protein